MFMVHDDDIIDSSVATGVGQIHISTFPVPLPLYYIDLGEDQSSLVEQFQQYEKITLTITKLNAFSFRYEIHSDILLYTITDEILDRVNRGEKIEAVLSEYPGEYSFEASQKIKLHWHSIFEKARKLSQGSWILLLHGATSNIMLIDSDGNITGRIEKPRLHLPDIEDPKTP